MHIAEWIAAAVVTVSALTQMESKGLQAGTKATALVIDSFIVVVLVLAALGH